MWGDSEGILMNPDLLDTALKDRANSLAWVVDCPKKNPRICRFAAIIFRQSANDS
jgi:hypothetical protein